MEPTRQTGDEAANQYARVRRRTELEAKLIAYRCGWLVGDEIRIRRLERELGRLLDEIGQDDPAHRLLSRARSR